MTAAGAAGQALTQAMLTAKQGHGGDPKLSSYWSPDRSQLGQWDPGRRQQKGWEDGCTDPQHHLPHRLRSLGLLCEPAWLLLRTVC